MSDCLSRVLSFGGRLSKCERISALRPAIIACGAVLREGAERAFLSSYYCRLLAAMSSVNGAIKLGQGNLAFQTSLRCKVPLWLNGHAGFHLRSKRPARPASQRRAGLASRRTTTLTTRSTPDAHRDPG